MCARTRRFRAASRLDYNPDVVDHVIRGVSLPPYVDFNDDPQFVGVVSRVVRGELETEPVGEVFVIRIDNWFDRKWLNFSGRGRVPFTWGGDWYRVDTALDEFHQIKKTFPPFVPNRVIEELCFIRENDGSYSLNPNGPFVHSQVRSRSCRNLHRRVTAFSGSALFAWFSSQTRVNGRGSLMVYRAQGSRVTSWYASLAGGPAWRLLRVENVPRERLQAWLAQ